MGNNFSCFLCFLFCFENAIMKNICKSLKFCDYYLEEIICKCLLRDKLHSFDFLIVVIDATEVWLALRMPFWRCSCVRKSIEKLKSTKQYLDRMERIVKVHAYLHIYISIQVINRWYKFKKAKYEYFKRHSWPAQSFTVINTWIRIVYSFLLYTHTLFASVQWKI